MFVIYAIELLAKSFWESNKIDVVSLSSILYTKLHLKITLTKVSGSRMIFFLNKFETRKFFYSIEVDITIQKN